MSPALHRIAGGGNIALIVVLAMVLSSGRVIFEPPVSTMNADLPLATGHAKSAVLIVMDGLREKTAFDERIMPNYCRLAKAGGRGTAQVECLLPSTVAGITTMGTGKISSPISFFDDFTARPSSDGGLFAAICAAGGRCGVAGPEVWTGRFGHWAADCTDWEASGDQNAARLSGGLKAIKAGTYQLLVLHFDQTDTAEHLHTPDSPQYREAAHWCDDAIGQILRVLPPDTCLLATADHGAADGGGHGGPETEVLQTPLVMIGPGLPTGRLPPLKQRDIPVLLSRALKVTLPESASVPGEALWWRCVDMAAAIIAGCSALPLLASLLANVPRRQHFFLNLSIWIALSLTFFGHYTVAMLLLVAALIGTTLTTVRGPVKVTASALFVGVAFGFWRFADACQHVDATPANITLFTVGLTSLGAAIVAMAAICLSGRTIAGSPVRQSHVELISILLAVSAAGWLAGGAKLAIAAAILVVIGQYFATLASRRRSAEVFVVAGIASIVTPVIALRCIGYTLSLSAIDVREAFAWAWVSGGLSIAVVIVILTLALPTISFWLPWRREFALQSEHQIGALGSGMGAALVAQIFLPTLALDAGLKSQTFRALALDQQLRVLAETIIAFLSLSMIYAVSRTKKPAGSDEEETAITSRLSPDPTMQHGHQFVQN